MSASEQTKNFRNKGKFDFVREENEKCFKDERRGQESTARETTEDRN